MPKPLKKAEKNPTDPNLLARSVIEAVIGEPLFQPKRSEISEYLAEIGRRGGLKGGKARAESLPAKKRQQIAKKAAEARWLRESVKKNKTS